MYHIVFRKLFVALGLQDTAVAYSLVFSVTAPPALIPDCFSTLFSSCLAAPSQLLSCCSLHCPAGRTCGPTSLL